jgi:hypothetical protein
MINSDKIDVCQGLQKDLKISLTLLFDRDGLCQRVKPLEEFSELFLGLTTDGNIRKRKGEFWISNKLLNGWYGLFRAIRPTRKPCQIQIHTPTS